MVRAIDKQDRKQPMNATGNVFGHGTKSGIYNSISVHVGPENRGTKSVKKRDEAVVSPSRLMRSKKITLLHF